MSIDTSSAPKSLITVQGLQLNCPAPFVEGHRLRANEAAVINQTYAENLRNNFAAYVLAKIKATAVEAGIIADAKAEMTAAQKTEAARLVDLPALQTEFDEYANNYDFGVRRTGTGAVVDPIRREALVIARQKVRDALKRKGVKLSDVTKDQIEEAAVKAVEMHPQLLEQAARIVEARHSVADDLLSL